jgi:hypothetical protein
MARFTVDLVAPVWELGVTSDLGRRRIIPITGGSFAGPLLSGEILNNGADWQILTADGTAIIDTRYLVWSKNPSDRLFMRPLDDNNAGARPIARGIGRTALDRGHGSEEIAGRCPFLGGCAPHGSGQHIHSGPAAANARQRE